MKDFEAMKEKARAEELQIAETKMVMHQVSEGGRREGVTWVENRGGPIPIPGIPIANLFF